ncbi:hypothetical protein PoB_004096800 [Plakobranchus ocellatus]|uniref:Uncharacterized protein n=1 Tax=Plakobranchus ocellatus TaxID=259542 RepID=A0AAV4B5V0_9GAST|nr:hypothetical protein PoB_004096800 [Plakobranchus ocellatus]
MSCSSQNSNHFFLISSWPQNCTCCTDKSRSSCFGALEESRKFAVLISTKLSLHTPLKFLQSTLARLAETKKKVSIAVKEVNLTVILKQLLSLNIQILRILFHDTGPVCHCAMELREDFFENQSLSEGLCKSESS